MSYCCTLILAFLQSSLEVSLPFANSNYACPPLVISLHRKSSSYVKAAESCRYRVLFWACEFGFRANLFMTHRAREMSSQAAEKVVQSALQTSGGSVKLRKSRTGECRTKDDLSLRSSSKKLLWCVRLKCTSTNSIT